MCASFLQANQLTEMVPVTRIFSQMGHFTKVAKTTKYFVDNISDLRPVVMTTDAITRFVYNPKPYMGVRPPGLVRVRVLHQHSHLHCFATG